MVLCLFLNFFCFIFKKHSKTAMFFLFFVIPFGYRLKVDSKMEFT